MNETGWNKERTGSRFPIPVYSFLFACLFIRERHRFPSLSLSLSSLFSDDINKGVKWSALDENRK